MNQGKRQAGLIKKDGKNLSHKEIYEEIVRERFNEVIESNDETNFEDLIYHCKGNTAIKRFNDSKNEIKLFKT